jgi:hypothetical protein
MAFLLAKPTPHNVNHDNDRFSMFNKKRDIPQPPADENLDSHLILKQNHMRPTDSGL